MASQRILERAPGFRTASQRDEGRAAQIRRRACTPRIAQFERLAEHLLPSV